MANIVIGAQLALNNGNQFVQQTNNICRNTVSNFSKITTTIKTTNTTLNRTNNTFNTINQNISRLGAITQGFINSLTNKTVDLLLKTIQNVAETMKETERAIGSLQAITSSIDGAKQKFQELNDLSRQIPQSFDEITQSALSLGKNGLDTSAASIEALAKIARGTGQSLSSVAQSLTNASLGQVKSLKSLGIVAKQEGDKINLTYQGITTTINANSAELQNYINKLANTKFADTLKPEMEGVTGASKKLGEAWGDMWRQLGDDGVTKIVIGGIEAIQVTLDNLTKFLKSKPVADAINGIADIFVGVKDTIIDLLGDITDEFIKAFDGFEKKSKDSCAASIKSFGNWVSFVGICIREIGGGIQRLFGLLTSFGEALGSTLEKVANGTTKEKLVKNDVQFQILQQLKKNGDYEKAVAELAARSGTKKENLTDTDVYKYAVSGMFQGSNQDYRTGNIVNYQSLAKDFEIYANNSINSTDSTFKESFDNNINAMNDRINKTINNYYDKVIKGIGGDNVTLTSELLKTGGAPTNLSGGNAIGNGENGNNKGGSSSVAKHTDAMLTQWRSYFAQLQQLWNENNLTESQKEDLRYQTELEKLANYHSQVQMSEQEYKFALETLEQEHQNKIQEIKNSALEEAHRQQEEARKKNQKNNFLGIDNKEYDIMTNGFESVGNAFQNMIGNMKEGTTAYRAIFAIQKGFAVASATMSCINAWANAIATQPFWPAGLAAYAQAVAMTGNIISQLTSVSMHDNGGKLTGLDIVGEKGPELLIGQSGNVIGRKQTEDLLGSKGSSNITVNLIEDSSRAGSVDKTETDDETIINIIVNSIRSGGSVDGALSSTYGLNRQGA